MTNSGGIMLVCRWASVNGLVHNKFHFIIQLLSQHLLDQSHRWEHQMNVQDLLKVNNKAPEESHWRHSGVFTLNSKHISHYALVFLVFLLLTLNK